MIDPLSKHTEQLHKMVDKIAPLNKFFEQLTKMSKSMKQPYIQMSTIEQRTGFVQSWMAQSDLFSSLMNRAVEHETQWRKYFLTIQPPLAAITYQIEESLRCSSMFSDLAIAVENCENHPEFNFSCIY